MADKLKVMYSKRYWTVFLPIIVLDHYIVANMFNDICYSDGWCNADDAKSCYSSDDVESGIGGMISELITLYCLWCLF